MNIEDLNPEVNSLVLIIKDELAKLWDFCMENDIELETYYPGEESEGITKLYINHVPVYLYNLTPYTIDGYIGVNNGDCEWLWRLNEKVNLELRFRQTKNSDWIWNIKRK
jgi:hypothetical protein